MYSTHPEGGLHIASVAGGISCVRVGVARNVGVLLGVGVIEGVGGSVGTKVG
jgi:hypothetical protein